MTGESPHPVFPGNPCRAGWVPWGDPVPAWPAGTLVLLSLKYLTSLFRYIPKAALAALIIMAVAPLFDTRILGLLWRVKSVYLLGTCLSFSLVLSLLDWGVRVLGSQWPRPGSGDF